MIKMGPLIKAKKGRTITLQKTDRVKNQSASDGLGIELGHSGVTKCGARKVGEKFERQFGGVGGRSSRRLDVPCVSEYAD